MTKTVDYVARGLTDADDRLGRPADSSRWVVPGTVDLVGDRISWRRTVEDWEDPARLRRGAADLLTDFLGIAEAVDPQRAVRSFTRRWGVFELCSRHALPPAHPPKTDEPRDTRRCEAAREDGSEPVDAYVGFARQAVAVLRIATDLAVGHPATGTAADWLALGIPDPAKATTASLRDTHDAPIPGDRTPVFTPRGMAEFWLRMVLRDWVELGDVRPEIDFGGGPPIILGGEGLFAALAAQLLFAATRIDGIVYCGLCSRQYAPKRRPRAGEAHYCDTCHANGDAARDVARRYRIRVALRLK
jgi:hypothetical protein